MQPTDQLALGWLGLSNALTFGLFAWDKRRARGSGRRISEWRLIAWSAAGGWPGGLMAMLLFRHKTAKVAFWIKFGIAFAVWGGLVGLWLSWRGR